MGQNHSSDGTVKIRAVFVDSLDDAKGMAWVEKEYGDMEFDRDSETNSDEDLDVEDSGVVYEGIGGNSWLKSQTWSLINQ